MIKQVAILSFILMLAATIPVNCTYASQYSLSNQDEQTGSQAIAQEPHVGKVAETMNSGGYTYILLQTKTKMSWVAIAETKIDVGQEVVLAPGMEMVDFHSKSLDRTFDSIIFSEGLITQGDVAVGQGSAHDCADAAHDCADAAHDCADAQKKTYGSKGTKPAAKENINVEKATGGNSYTVVELFEKRKELDNQDIVLRGEVIKVTARIMNKNWLHIQDGTGSAQDGNNDMVVTTMDLPSVGDIVTVKGVLFSDKDFGSGYRYDAIVEFGQVSE